MRSSCISKIFYGKFLHLRNTSPKVPASKEYFMRSSCISKISRKVLGSEEYFMRSSCISKIRHEKFLDLKNVL
jgi:hypothetical protein